MKSSMRWHAFGNCGMWTEWHVFDSTRKRVLMLAIPFINTYKRMFLEDTKTGYCWEIELVNGHYKLVRNNK